MSDEAELFAEFSATRSEAAFAGIIRLHTKLVFATALRQLRLFALAASERELRCDGLRRGILG